MKSDVMLTSPPAEGQKIVQEKEKEKETPAAAVEAADAKEKAEVADMKKGVSRRLMRCHDKH